MEPSAFSQILLLTLAVSVPIVLIGGLCDRNKGENPKGTGWQFIRYTVLSISIPVIGILALNNSLTGKPRR